MTDPAGRRDHRAPAAVAHGGLPESYQATFFRARSTRARRPDGSGFGRSCAPPPGTEYIYSNLNYCLLGLLVEQIAGRPYEAVVTDRLLAPLGIEGMRLAATYDTDPAQVVHPSAPFRNYMEVLGAAGSWVATPADVVHDRGLARHRRSRASTRCRRRWST